MTSSSLTSPQSFPSTPRLCSITDAIGSLTLDFDLRGCAGGAGQQGELLSLVHGVVGAGHHHAVPGPPALGLFGQLQDAAVGQHVNGDGGLWTNYSDTQPELEPAQHNY